VAKISLFWIKQFEKDLGELLNMFFQQKFKTNAK
jgi:hypothetical protein